MHMVNAAADFIKANMPFGLGGTLSDQDAWDVALFVDSHERPPDPRFTGNLGETRRLFHNSRWSIEPERVDDPQYRLPNIAVGERLVRHRADAADLHPDVVLSSQGERGDELDIGGMAHRPSSVREC
jgi:hypothetical protein